MQLTNYNDTAGGETAQQLKNCQKMLEFTSGKLAKFNELQKLESETANVQQAITSIHSEIVGPKSPCLVASL